MIYQFMLSLMSPDQKYHVCLQVVTKFLASFIEAEKRIELPSDKACPGGQALHDVLWLLVCKEMRICFSPKQAGEASADTLDDDQSAGVEAARSEIWRVYKVMMCNNVAPVLVQMKKRMEEKRSPFLGQLRHCLCEILREFKDDVKDILADDLQLANEVEYDLEAEQRSSSPCRGGPRKRTSLLRLMGDTPAPLQDKRDMEGDEVDGRGERLHVSGRHVPTPHSKRPPEEPSQEAATVRRRLKRKTASPDAHASQRLRCTPKSDDPTCSPIQADTPSQGTAQLSHRSGNMRRLRKICVEASSMDLD